MRRLLSAFLALVFAAASLPGGVLGASGSDPCELALRPADLPVDLLPERSAQASFNLSEDPAMCERAFSAEDASANGLTMLRTLVIISSSAKQADLDLEDYRGLLIESGWEELGKRAFGERGYAFVGSDDLAGVYSVQHLFRRGRVVGVIEATGPRLQSDPDFLGYYSRLMDQRIARGLPLFGPGGSVWPDVRVPTLVVDARLEATPELRGGLRLGGFSGLVSLDPDGRSFVTVTDRGPTVESGEGTRRRTLVPVPEFAPSIVKLEMREGTLSVLQQIPLKLGQGRLNPRTGASEVTGLPIAEGDVPAYDPSGLSYWGVDAYGVDPEGIAVDPRDGGYWIAEAFGPSILQVASDGTILRRLLPSGVTLGGPDIPRAAVLPPEIAFRKPGRGFAGIAISPDGTRLFAIMDSPLTSPEPPRGEAARAVRVLTLDISTATPKVDGMYLYLLDRAPGVGIAQQDAIRAVDLAAVSRTRLLVAERDTLDGGRHQMIYRVDLDAATDLLNAYPDPTRTVDQASESELMQARIRPAAKSPIVNVALLGYRAEKVDGIALVDETTFAVINDDAYGLAGFDSAGQPQPSSIRTRLTLVHLPISLSN